LAPGFQTVKEAGAKDDLVEETTGDLSLEKMEQEVADVLGTQLIGCATDLATGQPTAFVSVAEPLPFSPLLVAIF
jgi:hypothetical protein